MWSARSWVKLLDWLGEQRVLARTMIRRRVVRGRICDALSPHRLPHLSWHDLAEVLWRFGTVESPDGRVLAEEELAVFSPEELAERIASGAAASASETPGWCAVIGRVRRICAPSAAAST